MMNLHAPILTAAETRAAEEAAIANGASISELMDRAGAAIAEAVWRYGSGQRTLILCGPGNNGGDGYVAARLLAERGVKVRVAASAAPATPAAKAARKAWSGEVEKLESAKSAAILVDALFGTGLSRPLDDTIAAPLRRLVEAAHFSLAVDVPSGISTDDGAVLGAAPVTMTLALAALKPAHLLHPAAALCGMIRCADIGVAVDSATAVLARPNLAAPGPQDHKYSRGYVAVISGTMTGASMLAAAAAQRAGAGYVALAGGSGTGGTMALVHRNIEEVLADDRVDAFVIGPGLGRDAAARALIDRVIAAEPALVLDADALHLISSEDFRSFARRKSPVILTPHAGEFDALFGRDTGSKVDRARKAARDSGCKIIFKGADTVVASNDGRVAIAASASHWLASAGTGDVLAGIAGAMLARGLGPHEAASAAVWLHNEAARRAGHGLIADDLCAQLPAALSACL
jgi:ADP-dependent NAD(P)H-hydrate dehydratase / NAD(P)H-hydrate epimerase